MKDSLIMLSKFIKKPREVGALAPSSKYLTREILKWIDFKNSKTIVELGPGLGTFTKPILKKARPDTKLVCFEVNKEFCHHISNTINDKRLVIVNAGAEEICSNLKKLSIGDADCIISGLPFRAFTEPTRRKILQEARNVLGKQGRFILFQYTNGIGDLLDSYFDSVGRTFVPLNVPPSFVYVCVK
ncbi:methyltransferase [Candidatus Woesearchaeota archaeon]|nr:methyltransferase [Candidatus Woesearchaeota archaeon]